MIRKIRYKRLLIFIFIILIILFLLLKLFFLKITNIYVSGNYYLSDQSVIESAKLANYPSAIFTFSNSIESNIKKNKYVSDVNVEKKGLTKVYISIVENRPLFFDDVSKKTILMDGSSSDGMFNVPILVNSVSDEIYSDFLYELSLIDINVFNTISEIEYTPNSVDNKLFLITMNDGNYISVNLNRFSSISKYFDMVVNFNNHKGILYLDSGEYFKILDN